MPAKLGSRLARHGIVGILVTLAVWFVSSGLGNPVVPPQDGLRRGDDALAPDATAQPRLDPALSAAALEMALPPPGTPLAIAGVDPRRLRNLMQKGLRSESSDGGKHEALTLIHTAAALGYGPARRLIAQDFVRSRAVRAVVPAQDAMRYAMDAFVTNQAHRETGIFAMRAFAQYFEERKEATTLATHLVEIIRDDERLHSVERISRLLRVLASIEGACPSLGRAIEPRRPRPSDCSHKLAEALARYAKGAGAVGLEEASRRRALARFERINIP